MGDTDEPKVEAVEYEYESDEETPTDLGEVTEGKLTDEEVQA
jgi:hypothetical protein